MGAFLEIIQGYCREHGLAEKPKGGRQRASQMALNPRHIEVGEAFNNGETVQSLMERFEVQQDTILNHLSKYAQDGNPLRAGEDFLALSGLPDGQTEEALAAFEALGANVQSSTGWTVVTYDVLKALAALSQ
jgi:ATP-dependent DNA helicase RecQ